MKQYVTGTIRDYYVGKSGSRIEYLVTDLQLRKVLEYVDKSYLGNTLIRLQQEVTKIDE